MSSSLSKAQRKAAMIHRYGGFLKGAEVEFQNHQQVWTRGTIVSVENSEHRIEGPNGTMVEKRPSRVTIKYFSGIYRSERVIELPAKRVRAVTK